jgi:hypothetical protein
MRQIIFDVRFANEKFSSNAMWYDEKK